MKATKVPKSLQPFFASAPIENLDVNRDKMHIIQSLVKKSNLFGWQWMTKTYTENDIRQVISTSKQLRPKDAVFWSHYLSIPEREIACLQTKFQKTPEKSWKY
jgi:hypothetical protein